jgi:F0F1-type ATP synthase membrane subunit c/vacuolar-type H+-ATPase subunit K
VGAGLGVGSGTGGEGVGEGVGAGVGAEEQLTSPHSEPAKVTVREAGGFVH